MAAARSPTKAGTSERGLHSDSQDTPAKQSKSRKGKGKENTQKSAKASLQSRKAAGPSGYITSSGQNITSNSSNDILDWEWTTLADSTVSSRAPVFTADGSHFFSIVGTSVRIYSAKTGKVVSTLSASSSSSGSSVERLPSGEGHSDLITAAILNPENAYQLITASLDGTVKIWDYLDAVLLQTILVGQPILQMCAHDKHKGCVFIATLTRIGKKGKIPSKTDKGNTMIYRISTKAREKGTSVEMQRPSEVTRIGKTRAAISMAMSSSGSWLVVIAGVKAYVAMTSSLQNGFTKFISPEKLTCLAFHPTDDYFATGDEQGQIRLWYCLNNQLSFHTVGIEKRAQTTTMHWHAHAVSSIAFTANGSYLLSGGEESVLVIWQLQTGKKEFVPRLGSPIINIAVGREVQGKEEYLIGLSDGRIVTIDAASLSVSRSITRIRLDPAALSNRFWHEHLPFAYHKNTATIILPSSHPSSLQMYSPSSSVIMSELEVSPSNRVSRRDEKPIQPAKVEFVALSSEGNWMATVDRREIDDDFSAEIFLKFWHWESSTWVLNTRIDRPHGSSNIISMSFSPLDYSEEGILLQTAGLDGHIRTWCRRRLATKEGDFDEFWLARSSFTFRSETPSDICWSPDASLLAASYGPHVCLIDPHSNMMLDSLSAAEVKSPDSVTFLGRSGRFLLVAGNRDVALWDLVTRSVRWNYRTTGLIGRILPHPKEESFALTILPFVEEGSPRSTHIVMFHVSSSKPLRTRSLPFRLRTWVWYSQSSYSFVGITPTWDVVLFGDDVRAAGDDTSVGRGIKEDPSTKTQRTVFQDIFGKHAVLDEFIQSKTTPFTVTNSAGGLGVTSVLNGPSYLAPPLETLFSSFMDTLVVKKSMMELTDNERDEQEDRDIVVDSASVDGLRVAGRVIDENEVRDLEEMFSSQSIAASAKAQTNGISNGSHNRPVTTNGNHTYGKQASTLASNGTSKRPQQKPYVPQPDSSPVSIGKKRKKSTS